MEVLNSLGEFLTKFGGWGAFLLLSYAFRSFYLDEQKKEERQELKDGQTFALIVKMTADMSTVLAQNTVETRLLSENLEQMQALVAPVTKQDSRRMPGTLPGYGHGKPPTATATHRDDIDGEPT